MELGIALGRAYPLELDDAGALTVEFEPGADRAYAVLQSPENLQAFESFLQENTDNVVTVAIRKAEKANDTAAALQESEATDNAFEELLQETGIATVVDEFKGVIVAVQNTGKAVKKK